MKVYNLHRWEVTPREAIEIQEKLSGYLKTDSKNLKMELLGCADVWFDNSSGYGAVCIFSYPDWKLIEIKRARRKITFPYIPGLLAFREGKVLLECFKKIKSSPSVIIFDGQGLAHPRKMGLAMHLGLLLKKPTVGCAKSKLSGKYTPPPDKRGSFTYLYNQKEEVIGAALRTREGMKPIFVSAGYKISLEQAIQVILSLPTYYRIPQPLRFVDRLTRLKSLKNKAVSWSKFLAGID